MKVALITDTHFGARGDSLHFDNYFERFYRDRFFAELRARGITHIVHLGDCFDRRKFINFNILSNCRRYFFDAARDAGCTIDLIAGNHDTYFKNTNEVNSPELLLQGYDHVRTYDVPTEIDLDGLSVLLMPWICSGNYQDCMQAIQQSTAPVLFGHLELAGFTMYRGQVSEGGMDVAPFERFDLVCSGHFHHRSRKGNIVYLGNPYALTWSDYDDPRGFHVFDTETLDLEFVENPEQIFARIAYDDATVDYETLDIEQYRNKLIKLVVINKTNFYQFDRLVDRLYAADPLELKIIEDFSEFEAEALGDDELDLEDTLSTLNGFVDGVETDADRDRIKNLLKELYLEAQHNETV